MSKNGSSSADGISLEVDMSYGVWFAGEDDFVGFSSLNVGDRSWEKFWFYVRFGGEKLQVVFPSIYRISLDRNALMEDCLRREGGQVIWDILLAGRCMIGR